MIGEAGALGCYILPPPFWGVGEGGHMGEAVSGLGEGPGVLWLARLGLATREMAQAGVQCTSNLGPLRNLAGAPPSTWNRCCFDSRHLCVPYRHLQVSVPCYGPLCPLTVIRKLLHQELLLPSSFRNSVSLLGSRTFSKSGHPFLNPGFMA